MKLVRNLFVIGLSTLTSFIGHSQAKTFSLEDAKVHALENHISIINSQKDVDIAQKQILETTGMGLPQIDITGQFNHFPNIPVSVVDASFLNPMAPPGTLAEFQMGTEYSSTGTLQVNQLLFNGSYIVGLQASKHYKKFQESNYLLTQEDVVFNVIQAYQLAAVAKGNLTFVDSMVLLTQELVDKQQHYLDLGLMLQEDMDQLNYSLLTAQNAAVEANLQYKNALDLLKFSMGFDMGEEIEISETAEDLVGRPSLSTGDIHTNLQYSLLEQNITLSELSLKNNRFANLPSLYAFFSHSYNAYRNEFNFFANEKWFPQTVWGLQLNIPVFSGLQRHARTQQTKIKLMQDQNTLAQMERTLQFQESQLQNKMTSALDKYELLKQNSELARSIYENALDVEKIGKGNSILVTQKHNQLMMAQAQYLSSLIDLFNTQTEQDKLYNRILSKNQ